MKKGPAWRWPFDMTVGDYRLVFALVRRLRRRAGDAFDRDADEADDLLARLRLLPPPLPGRDLSSSPSLSSSSSRASALIDDSAICVSS
jgi:hypothetical protein